MKLRAREVAAQVRRGERTARQNCAEALGIIDARNPALNAIVQTDRERSFAEACEADRRVAAGESLPLAGVPYTLKDNLWAAGWRVAQGSRPRYQAEALMARGGSSVSRSQGNTAKHP